MDSPFEPYDTHSFENKAFEQFVASIVEKTNQIPPSPPVTNAELKKKAKMADVREIDATACVAIYKDCTSYLPPNLAYALMVQKLTSFKQADTIDDTTRALAKAMWAHGDLAGAELLIMLSLAENLTRTFAKLGNPEAIIAGNKLDDLKRKRGGNKGKKGGGDTKPDADPPERGCDHVGPRPAESAVRARP